MKKRGQVTLFIIIGVVLVALIVLLFYLVPRITETPTKILTLDERAEQLSMTMESCLALETENAIKLLGLQGGKLLLEEDSLQTDYSIVNYALRGKTVLFPSIEEMEKDIEEEIEYRVPICSNLDDPLINETENPEANVSIKDNQLTISYHQPILLRKGESEVQLDKTYTFSFEIRLNSIHDLAEELIQDAKEAPGVNINLVQDAELSMTIQNIENNILLYVLEDQNTIIDEEPYLFLVLLQTEEVDLELNHLPNLEEEL